MSNKLSLLAIEKDGCIRVGTLGDLTVADFRPQEKNPFEPILGIGWAGGRVLLDFSQTKFIDSAAIGWLISSQREFRLKGGSLAIYSMEPRVRRMLEILRVEQVVSLFNDEAAARAYVAHVAA